MAARKKTTKKAGAKKTTRRKPSTAKVRANSDTGRGMPPFVPSEVQRKQVEQMTGLGMTQAEIAKLIESPRTGKGINPETLRKHFDAELRAGRAKLEFMLGSSLVKKALSNDHPKSVTAAIFLLKSRFNWRDNETVVAEVAGGSGVLVVPATTTPSAWIEEVQKRNRELDAANGEGDGE